jgi:hypothetical protein
MDNSDYIAMPFARQELMDGQLQKAVDLGQICPYFLDTVPIEH